MSDQGADALLRRLYEAYNDKDIATIDAMTADDAVMHVPGSHPLAGEHRGKDAIWRYLGEVAAISGGRGGFELHSVAADGRGHAVALLTGTIREFIRPVVHIWRIQDGLLAQYWEANLDQRAEDQFWISACAQKPQGA